MTAVELPNQSRTFEPGTLGWTAADLDDPGFRVRWDSGGYEIVEGVLAIMPPAVFAGGEALGNLEFVLRIYLKQRGIQSRLATEVDLVLSEMHVYRADLVLITEADQHRLEMPASGRGGNWRHKPLVFPPSLIVESVSRGHEMHDRRVKRRKYAEFGVPNYWILDAFAQSLECLVLESGQYRTDQFGERDAKISPSLFPELVIDLAEVWGG